MKSFFGKRTWVAGLALGLLTAPLSWGAAPVVNLVPWPQTVEVKGDGIRLKEGMSIIATDEKLAPLAEILSEEIKSATGTTAKAAAGKLANAPAGSVVLQLTDSLKDEAYTLTIDAKGAHLQAGTYQGMANATATLLQAIEKDESGYFLPGLTITDKPDTGYRGVMIDLARNGHSPDSLKEIIRLCRFYKVRYLQLHLTDDQSFTFPSTAFPKLPSKGRSYTVEQMKDLVAYSKARGVTIIPEIDMPAHASAMIGSMPELFKSPAGGIINFRDPKVVEAACMLIDELAEMFPDSPYIHVGADEASLGQLQRNAAYQKAIADLKVDDIHGLFNHFLNQLHERVVSHGKKMIVWEGFEVIPSGPGKLATDVIVMPFDNYKNVETYYMAAGHPVINTSWFPLYIIPSTLTSPKHIFDWDLYTFGNYKTFDPRDYDNVRQYKVAPTDKVLGAQVCSWEQPPHLEIPSLRKRLAAMSERIWNRSSGRDYEDFNKRLDGTDARLQTLLARAVPQQMVLTASDSVYADHIELVWPATKGYPSTYTLLRSATPSDGDATVLTEGITDTHFSDKTAENGKKYYYWGKAVNPLGDGPLSKMATGSRGTDAKLVSAYEGFAEKPGTAIDGANSGTGWAAPWKSTTMGGIVTIKPDGLTYPGLKTTGGLLNITYKEEKTGVELRRDTVGTQGVNGSQMWFSYLIRANRVKAGHFFLAPNNSLDVGLGKQWGNGLCINTRTSNVSMENGKTYLVVGRYDCMNGDDTVHLWINPSLDHEPSIDDAGVPVRDDAEMRTGNTLRISSQQHGKGDYDVDEIRLGDNWRQVLPTK